MKLIFCLGNPEPRYDDTRHNIGFAVADALADTHNSPWKLSKKFRAEIAEITVQGEKVIIAKPTTYYNLVGESLQAIAAYYAIDTSDCLIIHDDLALDFGTIRTRVGGSGGGSNGIKSLNSHGGEETVRLRIGIKNDLANQIDNADFVLSRFSKAESEQLPSLLERAVVLAEQFIVDSLELTTHRTNNN